MPNLRAPLRKSAQKRLVIVVRADPVICGHSGEARHLAETAIRSGYSEVKILTWPIETLQKSGLPLKPLDRIAPYSAGITVERPPAVGDYKIPDGRLNLALKGRLVELFTDGVPTVCLSLYLVPHTQIVTEAVQAARSTGLPVDVTTVAEAVGSDITNVVRTCVKEGRMGPAMYLFATYLASDRCVAVSAYTRDLIVQAAQEVDAACGTTFAEQCRDRVTISYPAMDARALGDVDTAEADDALKLRGLTRGGYALFLSRITPAKGVDDLIRAYQASKAKDAIKLVIAGTGPALPEYKKLAAENPNILFFDDVDDDEKPLLMHGAAAYVLPSKPRPEFVETFGIALAEKMLVGGEGPRAHHRHRRHPRSRGRHPPADRSRQHPQHHRRPRPRRAGHDAGRKTSQRRHRPWLCPPIRPHQRLRQPARRVRGGGYGVGQGLPCRPPQAGSRQSHITSATRLHVARARSP